MAWYFALSIDGHPSSKVEGTKEFLALVQEILRIGGTVRADRDIGVQVSSYDSVLPSGCDRLLHGSFCRCERQFQRFSGAHLDLTAAFPSRRSNNLTLVTCPLASWSLHSVVRCLST